MLKVAEQLINIERSQVESWLALTLMESDWVMKRES